MIAVYIRPPEEAGAARIGVFGPDGRLLLKPQLVTPGSSQLEFHAPGPGTYTAGVEPLGGNQQLWGFDVDGPGPVTVDVPTCQRSRLGAQSFHDFIFADGAARDEINPSFSLDLLHPDGWRPYDGRWPTEFRRFERGGVELVLNRGGGPLDSRAVSRLRLSLEIEKKKMRRILVPLFAGGVVIRVIVSPDDQSDVDVTITPSRREIHSLLQALTTASAKEAEQIWTDLAHGPLELGRYASADVEDDPWISVAVGLLMLRLGWLKDSDTWVEVLTQKYPWIADASILAAHLSLSYATPDIYGALRHLMNARKAGAVYFFEADRLQGDLLVALAEDAPDRQQQDFAARELAGWRYRLPNRRQVGAFFSWLIASVMPEHTLASRRFLEDSVSHDPRSADAWSRLAEVLATDYLNRWNGTGEDQLQQAREAVQRALEIDPYRAQAHYAAGLVHRAMGQYQAALMDFSEALELNPNFARAYADKGNEMTNVGRPEEAQPLALKAIELSPFDPSRGVFYWILGRANFFMQNYDNAIVWLRRSIDVMPFFGYNRLYLISSQAHVGRADEVRRNLIEFSRLLPDYTFELLLIQEREMQSDDPVVRRGIEELRKGLLIAGDRPTGDARTVTYT
jgi:tetratricopeptide (TPR) repeat protein